MKRAQIDRRIFIEHERQGLLGPWLVHTLEKDKRMLKKSIQSAKRRVKS